MATLKIIEEANNVTNPLFYRDIESVLFRKHCISYMMQTTEMGKDFQKGDTFNTHYINQNEDLEKYANKVKFIEQAFEWDIMSYILYPFYWGANERWQKLYHQEALDTLFNKFLQCGMARVLLSVRPGFEDAIAWFFETGEIWNGNTTAPVIDDDFYLSIVDELQQPEGVPEGEPWHTIIPTSLTLIQNGSIALSADGLPCNCENDFEEKIEQTDKTLTGIVPEGVGSWVVNPDTNN